jgi:two-component system, chemotaxis family, sensor histidine kinase and response regulator PixL
MAIHSDIQAQAYGFFVQEAPELLQIIETELLQIRQERNTARVHALMRAAHSIKGGAANVGLDTIKTLAHRLEDCFRALYDEALELDDDLEALLLQGYDCLRLPLLATLEQGLNYDSSEALEAAAPIFDTLAAYLGDFLRGEDRLPSVAEMGIDIAQTIFETDVAQGLARLSTLSANDPMLAGELRAQADVFLGLGELLELPGTMEIAQLTLVALDENPDRVQEIFVAAFADFQAASEAVLQGDRKQGGNPSEALRQLSQPAQSVGMPATALQPPTTMGSDLETNEEANWAVNLPVPSEMSCPSPMETLAAEDIFAPMASLSGNLDDVFGGSDDYSGSLVDVSGSFEDLSGNLNDVFGCSDDYSGSLVDVSGSFEDLSGNLDDVFGRSDDYSGSLVDVSGSFEDLSGNLDDVFGGAAVSMARDSQSDITVTKAAFNEAILNEPIEIDDIPSELFQPKLVRVELPTAELPAAELPRVELPTVELTASEPESIQSLADVAGTDLEIAPEPANQSSQWEIYDAIATEAEQPEVVEQPVVEQPVVVELDRSNGLDEALFALQDQVDSFLNSNLAEQPAPEAISPAPTNFLEANFTEPHTEPKINDEAILPQQVTSKVRANTPAAAASQLTVKLEIERLDRMNNQLGELAINRNSLSLQNAQLQESLQEMRRRFGQFLEIGTQLRGQLGQMLISPERYARNRRENSPIALAGKLTNWGGFSQNNNTDSDFDALELDSYNDVYNRLQEAMEMILQIEESVGDVSLFAERTDRDLGLQQRILNTLRDELMWGRMLPLNNILDGFPRMIRDLALRYKKPVDLKILGGSTLVDKAILDKLYDPLLHLIRNAFDHGIESPELRRELGKEERGQIRIQAYHLGSRTIIEIQDDGKGIDYSRIRAKAIDLGLLAAGEAETASPNQLLNYLFEPGFSTAAKVSELSGRGVGLDIVRGQIQAMKGNISITSEPGRGTLFTLQIPLTLSITKLLLVWSGSTNLALPSDSIIDIVNPQAQDLKTFGGERFLYWQEQIIPIHNLQKLLPYNCPLSESNIDLKLGSVPTPEDWALPLLILRQSGQPLALEVEKLLGEQELVIKPFSNIIKAPSYLYGSTILGNGALVSVVDGLALLSSQRQDNRITIGEAPTPVRPAGTVPTVLVVDDSTTMRQTLSLSLEKSGYRILQAKDGREGLDQLQLNPQVQLVICDIEMPVMNGFEFLTQKRQQAEIAGIPVAMLTSRGGDKHRKLAMQLGAIEYFTKPYIEQQFLARVKQLIQGAAQPALK